VTETLVVVPRPTFGQLLYAADGTTFKPQSSDQEGVVVLQRDPLATTFVPDRIRLLDGGGTTFFDDAVAKLLCGVTSCG
jgi:hypothetical protein